MTPKSFALSRALLLLVLALGGCATASIGPGQVGVLWRAAGGTERRIYSEGQHHLADSDQMFVYDLRTMNQDAVLTVIAVNGLTIRLDASVRYHLIPEEVVAVHEQLGPDYYQKILEPVLRSEARRVIGRYTPEEIYSTKRDVIERETSEGIVAKIAGKHIALEAVLIRNVELPQAIRSAIDAKLAAEQEVLKMRYVVEVAKATAEQRRIEAQGVADYNHTVAASLGPQILEFQRIEQITRLAASPNSKTVVLGAGDKSAPVLLTTPGAR